MARYLVIIADQKEIQAFLDYYDTTPICDHVYNAVFDNFSIDILVTGWGSGPTVNAINQWLSQSQTVYDHWINIGIAGLASPDKRLHQTYAVSAVGTLTIKSPISASQQWESGKDILTLNPLPIFPQASLHTASVPVKEGLGYTYELVDMEGYGIANLAKQTHTPLTLLKTTSDFVNTAASLFIYIHLPTLSEQIRKDLLQALLFLKSSQQEAHKALA